MSQLEKRKNNEPDRTPKGEARRRYNHCRNFVGVPSVYRDDIETRLAAFAQTVDFKRREEIGFASLVWFHAAPFIDIAGRYTSALDKVRRHFKLEDILRLAWVTRHQFDPLREAPTEWFHRVCQAA